MQERHFGCLRLLTSGRRQATPPIVFFLFCTPCRRHAFRYPCERFSEDGLDNGVSERITKTRPRMTATGWPGGTVAEGPDVASRHSNCAEHHMSAAHLLCREGNPPFVGTIVRVVCVARRMVTTAVPVRPMARMVRSSAPEGQVLGRTRSSTRSSCHGARRAAGGASPATA